MIELTAKIQELQNKVNCMNDIPRYQSTCVFPTFFKILAEC